MKAKITYINDDFFHHSSQDSGVIVIFRKARQISNNQNISVANIIESNVKKIGIEVSCSELLNGIDNHIILEDLKSTLFVYDADQGYYISQDLQPIFANNQVELKISNTIIAKIVIGTKNNKAKLLLLFTFLVAIFLVNYIKENNNKIRIKENTEYYQSDILRIEKIEKIYNNALNSSNIYAPYLSSSHSSAINEFLTTLKKKADYNYSNTKDEGKYCILVINEDSIRHEISRLVENAENAQKQKCEADRKEVNAKAYNDNINLVDLLFNNLKEEEKKNERYELYIDRQELNRITESLSQLKAQMNNQKNKVEDKGFYIPIPVEQDAYKKSIDKLFEDAKEKYILAQQKIKKQKMRNSKKQAPTSVTRNKKKYYSQKVQQRNNENLNSSLQSYNSLVSQANQDYKAFYYSNKKDKGAAQRAITKYQKAQNINYDSSINARIKKLQNELTK